MGVKGLLTFIKKNEEYFFTKITLHNTKIIIDGNNFVHYVSNIIIDESNIVHFVSDPHRFGGDYERLARTFKFFFNTMKKCNIAPYVVFDGGNHPDERKLDTTRGRKSDRRQESQEHLCRGGLPILSYETVLKLLVELKIPHICCDYEADREIAVLAKKWGCPVFSKDSDFFVYGLQGGFVLLDDSFDMKLHVHNTTSGTDNEIQPNYTLQENEFIYVYVKCCNCEKFVSMINNEASSFLLPLLATVMGNDYVDHSILKNFHQKLRSDSRKDRFKFQMSDKVASILNWLTTIDSEENALDQVLVTLEATIDENGQEKATVEDNREKTKKSFSEYKDIREFESFDLEKEYDNQTSEVIYSRKKDVSWDVSENSVFQLKDYYGRILPTWLVNGMRKGKINRSFLQDVAVLHRVIFDCQVESVKQQSAYACSRDIRALIYGVILNPCPRGDGESAENQRRKKVEEFDREEEKEKREFVKPLKKIGKCTSLPTLETLISLSKSDRKHLLFAPLRPITKNLTEQMSSPSQLMILIIIHWFNHSQPKVSEAHLSALIIGIIVLHVRALQPENKEDPLQFSPSAPVLFQEIENVIKSMNEEQVNRFKRRMDGYFKEKNGTVDDTIIHSFAQFQSTLLHTLILNQLLQNPVKKYPVLV